MSLPADCPPAEYCGAEVVDQDANIQASWCAGQPNPIIWHLCPATGRWEGAGTPLHTLVSRTPLHLEASLLFDWCGCNGHGWIRDGHWVAA